MHSCFLFLQIIAKIGILAVMLMLYLCAGQPSVSQVLIQNNCLRGVGPFTQSKSVELKVLSKALCARLIPLDSTNDDMAVLTLLNDDEVQYIVDFTIASTKMKYMPIPMVSVMLDLSRSLMNLWTFAFKDVALVLSNVMDELTEDDQAQAALMIWRIMQLNYDGVEHLKSTVVNNGTLEGQ